MQFPKLVKGKLIKRYKRFLADVELPNGEVVIAHCPNTGAMTGCAEPGFTVFLSPSANPKRKLAYTWELALTYHNEWIGINTNSANKIVKEALTNQLIPELVDYSRIQAECNYGEEGSRIDFLLSGANLSDCYVEVKSVTLAEGELGSFPDAVTTRGQKHLRELINMVSQGKRAVLLFCVQHSAVKKVMVAEQVDPVYARLMAQALTVGVQVLCYSVNISQEKIAINQRLPFLAPNKS